MHAQPLPRYCTVSVVLRNVWSLVPMRIANAPGSTTNVPASLQSASELPLTSIVTVLLSPALVPDVTC